VYGEDKERNLTTANWVFAETFPRHLIEIKFCLVSGLWELVLSFEFHQNQFPRCKVQNSPYWPLAYTTACTTVQAVMKLVI